MKTAIKRMPLLQPVPIILLCVSDGQKTNISTLGDVAVAGLNPPLVFVSTNEGHYSTGLIDASGRFSINVPPASLLSKVDYCGMVSGREADKSALFTIERVEDTPTLAECPISLVVIPVSRTQIQQRVIYIAQVRATLVEEELLKGGTPSLSGLEAVYYGLDNSYYTTGRVLGRGYTEGKKHRRSGQRPSGG